MVPGASKELHSYECLRVTSTTTAAHCTCDFKISWIDHGGREHWYEQQPHGLVHIILDRQRDRRAR